MHVCIQTYLDTMSRNAFVTLRSIGNKVVLCCSLLVLFNKDSVMFCMIDFSIGSIGVGEVLFPVIFTNMDASTSF